MSISRLQLNKYKRRLDKILDMIPELEEELQIARSHGDLSENAEYDSAKAALSEALMEKSELENLIKEDVVEYDRSSIITLGSLIKLTTFDELDPLILLVSDTGSIPIEPVLNTNSDLGRLILGNTSNTYTVGRSTFYVEKIKDPESVDLEIFDDSEIIDKLLEEV